MPDKKDRGIETYSGGFFNGLTNHLKLVLRLMGDRRVSPLVKLIPVGTLAYLVIPDLIIGPFDDAAIIGLGLYIFVELCPQDVVEEHRAQRHRRDGKYRQFFWLAPAFRDAQRELWESQSLEFPAIA